MGKKSIIAITVLLIFSVSVPPVRSIGVIFPGADLNQPKVAGFGTMDLESNILAQNENNSDEKTEESTPGTEAKEPESESVDNDQNTSSKAKSKPLKPFVPSEKIPGDQAVDFPVDI